MVISLGCYFVLFCFDAVAVVVVVVVVVVDVDVDVVVAVVIVVVVVVYLLNFSLSVFRYIFIHKLFHGTQLRVCLSLISVITF